MDLRHRPSWAWRLASQPWQSPGPTTFDTNPQRPLAGWFAEALADPSDELPVLVAIHGGSFTSHYWAFAAMGDATIGHLGLPVIAVDRPGYGATGRTWVGYDEQAELVGKATSDALESLLGRPTHLQKVVLVGHSIGAMVATTLAARRREMPFQIVGLDVSGYGMTYRAGEDVAALESVTRQSDPIPPVPESRTNRFFGPAEGWDPAVVQEDAVYAAPTQPRDIAAALTWPTRMPTLADAVDVPVRYTLAQFDALWSTHPGVLDEIRTLFSHSPHVEATIQEGVGHCNHLHKTAAELLRGTAEFALDCASKVSPV